MIGLTQVTVLEIAEVAAKIAFLGSRNAPVHLDVIAKAFNCTHDFKDLPADEITINKSFFHGIRAKEILKNPDDIWPERFLR